MSFMCLEDNNEDIEELIHDHKNKLSLEEMKEL